MLNWRYIELPLGFGGEVDMALESEEAPWLTGAQVRSAVEAGGPFLRMCVRSC